MLPITRQIAQHIARTRYADLPAETVLAAKASLLDALGVSLAASGLEPACLPFAGLAAESPGPCRILGHALRATPLMAALANGALAHALDFEDTYDAAPVHPNAAAVPAALALIDALPQRSGEELVLALALGSDLVCRLGSALRDNPDRFGFYTPPILGAFGAAACAAKLLELNEDGIVATFALTLSQATSSAQFKRDPRSDARAVRDAFSAHAGLMAALLAARGVHGFEAAFEGEHGLFELYARGACDPAPLLDKLGRRFLGERVSLKPWPSCRGTHAYIEAALELRARGAIDPEQIEVITLYGATLQEMLMQPLEQKRAPRTAIDAKFSLPYCVALALVHGHVALGDFTPAALDDPRVLELARRVTFVARPGDGISGQFTLRSTGGMERSLEVTQPLGHPDRPLGEAQRVAKFVDCAGRAAQPIDPVTAQLAAAEILEIDRAERVGAQLRAALDGAVLD